MVFDLFFYCVTVKTIYYPQSERAHSFAIIGLILIEIQPFKYIQIYKELNVSNEAMILAVMNAIFVQTDAAYGWPYISM